VFGLTRQITKSLLRKFGFGVWAINSSETLNFENLLYVLRRWYPVVTFLHIGAHDGKSFSDPLHHFVVSNPTCVSGVMVEPVKQTYEKLVGNYGHFPSIRLLNVAVHPTLTQVRIHKLSNVAANRTQYATGLSTVDADRLLKSEIATAGTAIEYELVDAISVSTCAQEIPLPQTNQPHVICIDTEGLDFELVRSINFDLTRPHLIRFEHNLCDKTSSTNVDEYFALVDWLNARGYQVFTEHNDAVAVSNKMIPIVVQPY